MSCENLLSNYAWIDAEFIKNVLENKMFRNREIKVSEFTIQPALKPGENYGSQIIRAHVKYSYSADDVKGSVRLSQEENTSDTNVVSLIIKASLGAKLVRSCNVFEKEIFMFEQIIPKVENILQKYKLSTKIAPVCIKTNLELSYLILEDLTVRGYKNVNRTLGLDYDHLKVVIPKLARWHAATAILVEEHPDLRKLYEKPHVNLSGSPKYRDLLENATSACGEVFQSVAGFENISQKLFKIEEKVFEQCCNACTRDDAQFNVLAHGDLWGNNILFAYNENDHPNDALLVDFQVGFWGSPVLDLTYLLFTSSHASVKDLEWERLIQHYYEELNATLQHLNYQSRIPTLDDILFQISKKGIYSAIFSLFSVALRLISDEDDNAVVKFLGSTEDDKRYRLELMSRPNTVLLLSNLVKYFDKKGFLD